MELLRRFFISKGVDFGTDTSIDLFPEESDGDVSIQAPDQK
ncbi:MAG TPA: hypothetical protein VHK69_19390 [Chitinophagaceae bacterium]|jgi:hypothetical protein|nr:hypothetical protein [Chitinophagaceae bacterium]